MNLSRRKLSFTFAALVVGLVGGGVAWRLWGGERVELEGTLREGSLRCDDECHFDFVLVGKSETKVRVDSCIMPDTLRDWPGRPVQLMVAGTWQGEQRLQATALLSKNGYWQGQKPSGGRPTACFVPPAVR